MKLKLMRIVLTGIILTHIGVLQIVRASESAADSKMSLQQISEKQQFKICYGSLEVTFADAEYGFAIDSIVNSKHNAEFGRWPDQATKSELWKVRLTDDVGKSEKYVIINNLSCSEKYYIFDKENQSDGLKLFFNGIDLPDEQGVIDVIVSIKPLADIEMLSWRISVKNRSEKYSIWDVKFPIITFASINNDGVHSVLAIPRSEGRCMRDPINGKLVTSGLQETEDHSGFFYPGSGLQMQYTAYYQDFGNDYYPERTRGAGLYLATHDSVPLSPKHFSYTPDKTNQSWMYICTNHTNDASAVGADFVQQYDHVIGAYDGDWFDASQIYRSWALKQPWARKGPLASRTDIPEWYKKITAVHRAESTTDLTNNVRDSLRYAKDFADEVTGPIAVHWYQWDSDSHANKDRYTLPPISTAQPHFKEVVARMQNNGIYPFPYISGRCWDMTIHSWNDPQVQASAIRCPDGEIDQEIGKGNKKMNVAHMDFGSPFWRKYLANTARDIVKNYGVKGLYLDQCGQCRDPGNFFPEEDRPIGMTPDMIKFEHIGLEEIANAVGPDVMLWGEGCADFSIDVLHGKIIHYNLWAGFVPMFSAVYHDYFTFFGRNLPLSKGSPESNYYKFPEMSAGWLLTIGAQIGRVAPDNYDDPQISDIMEYIKKLTKVRSQNSEYLMLGRLMRPPVVKMDNMPIMKTYSKGDVELPAVLASCWQSPEKKLAIVITNMYDESHNVNVVMDLDEYEIGDQPSYKITEMNQTKEGPGQLIISSRERVLEFNVNINPFDVKLFEISE